MKLFRKVLAILFPEKCLGCGTNDTPLCNACLSKVGSARTTEISWCSARHDYKHPLMRQAIWELKYKNRRGLAEILARDFHDLIFEELADTMLFSGKSQPIIVPIPLSAHKMRTRGFNQTELLARAFARQNPGEYLFLPHALKKVRDTKPQARTGSRKERLENLRGSFRVRDPKLVHRKIIILVDDVTTTGATLREARRVLMSAGAKKVLAVTVAH